MDVEITGKTYTFLGNFGHDVVLCYVCQITISIQNLKLLDEVSGYYLYYSLTYPFKWKPFRLETYIGSHYLVLNFYQINKNNEIRTRDRLVIKALIPYQRTISTQKLKLLGEVSGYHLYYFLTILWFKLLFFNVKRYLSVSQVFLMEKK